MKVRYVLWVAMFFLAGCGSAPVVITKATYSIPGQVSVPMRLLHTGDAGGLPLVEVRSGGLSGYWLLDTGAELNVISHSWAEQLQLSPIGKRKVTTAGASGQWLQQYQLPSVSIGTMSVAELAVTGMDLSLLAGKHESVNGILGMPFLREMVLELDFQRQQVVFRNPSSLKQPSKQVRNFPLRIHKGMPLVTARIEGREASVLLDTGNSGGLVLLPGYVSYRKIDLSHLPRLTVNELGGKVQTRLARAESLMLGSAYALRNVPIALPEGKGMSGFSGFAGSLGNAAWLGDKLILDFPKKRVYVAAHDHTSPVVKSVAGGFGFIVNQDSVITAVLPGSSADDAGLQSGDRISFVMQGQSLLPVNDRYSLWAMLAGKDKVTLRLKRNTQTAIDVKLARRPFLPAL